MSRKRELAKLLAAISTSRELSPALVELLRDIISRVTAALKSRYQDADIEDAIAEALLLLAQRPTLYRQEEGSLEGFIYIVARNVAAKRIRLRAAEVPTDPRFLPETANTMGDSGEVDREASVEMPPHQGAARRQKQLLDEFLRKLPADQHEILQAFAVAKVGEPWAAKHAKRTGDNANRVRVRLHRLIARLRREMGA
jgi:RNA polymerase sigma factor (sigma-70 family)